MKNTKFEDTPQYKKGKLGEQLVREMIIKNGWVVYTPSEGQAHAFDILATKNKTRIIAIDVKTKARLNKWEAQGINRRTYIEYCYFSEKHNIPFYLVFVDDKNGEIHAVNIAKLHNPIQVNAYIIAWPLSQMQLIGKIDSMKIQQLSEFDTRTWAFEPNNQLTLF